MSSVVVYSEINKQVNAYRHHVCCMRLSAMLYVCVCVPEGDFLSQSVVMEAAAVFH